MHITISGVSEELCVYEADTPQSAATRFVQEHSLSEKQIAPLTQALTAKMANTSASTPSQPQPTPTPSAPSPQPSTPSPTSTDSPASTQTSIPPTPDRPVLVRMTIKVKDRSMELCLYEGDTPEDAATRFVQAHSLTSKQIPILAKALHAKIPNQVITALDTTLHVFLMFGTGRISSHHRGGGWKWRGCDHINEGYDQGDRNSAHTLLEPNSSGGIRKGTCLMLVAELSLLWRRLWMSL